MLGVRLWCKKERFRLLNMEMWLSIPVWRYEKKNHKSMTNSITIHIAAMYLLCKFSLANARSTHISQVITSHTKIIFAAVNVLKTCIFAENNQHIKTLINMRCVQHNASIIVTAVPSTRLSCRKSTSWVIVC